MAIIFSAALYRRNILWNITLQWRTSKPRRFSLLNAYLFIKVCWCICHSNRRIFSKPFCSFQQILKLKQAMVKQKKFKEYTNCFRKFPLRPTAFLRIGYQNRLDKKGKRRKKKKLLFVSHGHKEFSVLSKCVTKSTCMLSDFNG